MKKGPFKQLGSSSSRQGEQVKEKFGHLLSFAIGQTGAYKLLCEKHERALSAIEALLPLVDISRLSDTDQQNLSKLGPDLSKAREDMRQIAAALEEHLRELRGL